MMKLKNIVIVLTIIVLRADSSESNMNMSSGLLLHLDDADKAELTMMSGHFGRMLVDIPSVTKPTSQKNKQSVPCSPNSLYTTSCLGYPKNPSSMRGEFCVPQKRSPECDH